MRVIAALATLLLLLPGPGAQAQLRGHGGPVRTLAISPDGKIAVSGSFDTSVIRWSLERNTAEQVLRYHDSAVNAVVMLPDGRIASAGQDARIAIWRSGEAVPERVLEGHTAPIAALAVSPDGTMLASASWDHTARLWPLAGGAPRLLEGHRNTVNGVAFAPDGRTVVTSSADVTLRLWPIAGGEAVPVLNVAGYTALAIAPGGEIVAADWTGMVHFRTAAGLRHREVYCRSGPIVALAISPDGRFVAAASTDGLVAIIDREKYEVARYLVGPGLPVWSAAFFPDSRTFLTGGGDGMIRRWDAVTGQPVGSVIMGAPDDPLAAYAGDPGADVFRACIACHTLTPDDGNRAGPTLAGIFGRRIATLPGYNFSAALEKLDIVWTPETVSKLFEIGPAAYTPGTKMPEQRIGSAADRAALVKFLQRATTGH